LAVNPFLKQSLIFFSGIVDPESRPSRLDERRPDLHRRPEVQRTPLHRERGLDPPDKVCNAGRHNIRPEKAFNPARKTPNFVYFTSFFDKNILSMC